MNIHSIFQWTCFRYVFTTRTKKMGIWRLRGATAFSGRCRGVFSRRCDVQAGALAGPRWAADFWGQDAESERRFREITGNGTIGHSLLLMLEMWVGTIEHREL